MLYKIDMKIQKMRQDEFHKDEVMLTLKDVAYDAWRFDMPSKGNLLCKSSHNTIVKLYASTLWM